MLCSTSVTLLYVKPSHISFQMGHMEQRCNATDATAACLACGDTKVTDQRPAAVKRTSTHRVRCSAISDLFQDSSSSSVPSLPLAAASASDKRLKTNLRSQKSILYHWLINKYRFRVPVPLQV